MKSGLPCINVMHREKSCREAKLPMMDWCTNCIEQRIADTVNLLNAIRREAPDLWQQIVEFALAKAARGENIRTESIQ